MSFNRSGYIGRAPGDSSIVLAKQYFQPTGAGKTFTFTAGYDPGLIDVYRNGVKLINVLDYAATDGSTIVLDTPVGVGTTVQVVAYKGFNLTEVKSTNADFTVGTNLYVQSGFGSFAQGITANEINVTGIGTIGIGSFVDIRVSGGATFDGTTTTSGAVSITDTTDSTSSTTGSLIVSGGVGIAKNVYIGAGLSVAGTLTYEDVTNVDSVGVVTAKSGINITGGDYTQTGGGEFKVGAALTIGSAGVATFIAPAGVGVTITPATGKIEATTYYGDGSNLSNITSTTINSNADNRLITGSGTANTLNGESTLTYDGASLKVGSGITMDATAGVTTYSNVGGGISFRDVAKLYMGTDGGLQFYREGLNTYLKNIPTGGDLSIHAKDGVKLGSLTQNILNITGDSANTSWDLRSSGNNVLIEGNEAGGIGGLHIQAGVTTFGSSCKTIDANYAELRIGTGATIGSAGVGTFYGGVYDNKGNVRRVPQSQYLSGAYTAVAADAGGFIVLANGSAALTIPNNTFSTGDVITIINAHSSTLGITNSASGLFNAATGVTGNKNLTSRGMATLIWVSSQIAYISGAGLEDA